MYMYINGQPVRTMKPETSKELGPYKCSTFPCMTPLIWPHVEGPCSVQYHFVIGHNSEYGAVARNMLATCLSCKLACSTLADFVRSRDHS